MRFPRRATLRTTLAVLACYALMLGGFLAGIGGVRPVAGPGVICGHEGGSTPQQGDPAAHDGLCCTAACASGLALAGAPERASTAFLSRASLVAWRMPAAFSARIAAIRAAQPRGPPFA